MIQRNRAQEAVRDNKSCYRALQLNQYITPDAKDKMMTKRFMKGVLQHKYWLPKSDQIKVARVCTFPPIKSILAQLVYDLIVAPPPEGRGEGQGDAPHSDSGQEEAALQEVDAGRDRPDEPQPPHLLQGAHETGGTAPR